MSRIRVLIKAPGRKCNLAEIENSDDTFKLIVNGPLETRSLASGLVCVMNENGKLVGASRNIPLWGGWDVAVGTLIFCGFDEEEGYTDITDRDIEILNFVYGVEA